VSSVAGQRVTVVVNDTPYTVEVGDLMAWPLSVTVNGTPYRVAIEVAPPTPDAGGAADDGREGRGAPLEVVLPAAAPPAGPLAVRAPMPGTVTAVHVRPGDRVTAGQALCTLEAMKMRNTIRAARSGRVAEVAVEAGRAVGCGDVLVTLEAG
jgi:biotin carboxyl carrier protein